MESAKLALEFPIAWLGAQQKLEGFIEAVINKPLLDQLVESGKPVIVAVPHIGNWEFLWQWIQLNYSSFGMYSPAKIPALDQVMYQSRQRFGGEAFATDAKGIISLLRRLKKPGVMMILTDQAPKPGSGIFVPFFKIPAYTMTLVHKFLQKSEANLVFASCLRKETKTHYEIDFYLPKFDVRTPSAEEFNEGMNMQIEQIVLQAPAQYQWSYKRFKRQQDGTNYYKKT